MRFGRHLGTVLLATSLTSSSLALAQQHGSDVGGQPARRKVTKYPVLVTFASAPYPEEERASGREASVVLEIEISETGLVTRVKVVQGASPSFDAAAEAAARDFVFTPAEVDDKPAPSKITYRYDFVFREPEASPPPPPPAAPEPAPPAPPPAPAPAPDEVRVRGTRPHESIDYKVAANQARRVPGTQGDVLKVVQNLPGVSRPPLASGQLVVWGSAPKETRTYVDGVEIPALYHGSGLRGTLNSDQVASIDLVPGAFSAEYGRGLGGLVRVDTKTIPRGTHGYVGVDTLDASALISTELGSRARISISARQSWLDRVMAATNARDVGDYFPIPRYRDGQIKATIDLRARESLDIVVLGSTDDLTRTVPSADPAKTRAETTSSSFWRTYARYTYVAEDGSTSNVTPFVGQDRSELEQSFGQTPTHLTIRSDRWGVRASHRMRLEDFLALEGGVDVLGAHSSLDRRGSLTLPPREGDMAVFGQAPSDDYAADSWTTNIVNAAPWLIADVRIGPVTVRPGARFDAYLVEGSRQTPRIGDTPAIGFSRLESAFDPRVSARWSVTPRMALTAAWGRYHQAPEAEDLSAVFGTPALALSRATHTTFGESIRITDTLTADVVGFYKTMNDLVVRSRLVNPMLARSLTQNGEGRSYGVQFLVRQALWKGFFGWVSYAISRSERRYDGDELWRAFDFDQPHVLSVVASQEIGRLGFGARFRYASGNPRTPVVGSYYDARNDRYDPVFGPQNTIRVPAFWQLDLRVDWTQPLGKGLRLVVFADVQNVTAHENAEEIVYSADFRERGIIRGLPTIAVVGGRLEF